MELTPFGGELKVKARGPAILNVEGNKEEILWRKGEIAFHFLLFHQGNWAMERPGKVIQPFKVLKVPDIRVEKGQGPRDRKGNGELDAAHIIEGIIPLGKEKAVLNFQNASGAVEKTRGLLISPVRGERGWVGVTSDIFQ